MITMPWIREEKYFPSLLIWRQNHSKLCKQNFAGSLTSTIIQKSQIYRWVYKIQTTRLVNNLNKIAENPKSGRKLTARCPDNVDAVKDSVGRNPKKSLRWGFKELGLSRALLQRILKKELQLYPYRIQIKHKLTSANRKTRSLMCRWFKNKIQKDPGSLDDIWFSDEGHFWLCGHVNSNNCVYWGVEAPDVVLHSCKLQK